MSGITNPAELYFKNGLWAYDPGADSWRRLETTSGAHTLEVKLGASAEVHQNTPDDLRVGIYAYTAGGWVKLLADDSDFLKVDLAAQDIDVEVKQTTPADLTPGVCGWDGDSWQKLPLLWGYSDRWVEEKTETATAAEDVVASTVAVLPGYVHVLQAASVNHGATAAKHVQIFVGNGGITPVLFENLTSSLDSYDLWQGEIVLKEGDQVSTYIASPGAGKTITIRVWGYKMKIAE